MSLNTPMKIVLAMVIILMIGVGFYLLNYQGKMEEIKKLEADKVAKEEQYKINEEKVKKLPELIKKNEQLTNDLNGIIQEKLPKEDATIFVPKFIQSMEQLIAYEKRVTDDDTLQVISITPGQLSKPGKSTETAAAGADVKALMVFPKQPFQVNLRAKYNTVIHLLHQLADLRLQRLVTITRISLSPGGAIKPGVSPTLTVNMPMVAYLNEGKKEEEAPKAGAAKDAAATGK